jgi:hypothetical protein
MATFNTMAIVPLLSSSSNIHVVWPTESNPVALAPTVIHVVWPTVQDQIPDISFTLATTPIASEAVRIVEGESGIAYRMRGYDATLGRVVFWSSVGVDDTGNAYGGPGPLSDIVVHMLLGT